MLTQKLIQSLFKRFLSIAIKISQVVYKLNKQFGQNKSGEFILKKELRSPSLYKLFREICFNHDKEKVWNEKTDYFSPKISESIFWLNKKRYKSVIKIKMGKTLEVISVSKQNL